MNKKLFFLLFIFIFVTVILVIGQKNEGPKDPMSRATVPVSKELKKESELIIAASEVAKDHKTRLKKELQEKEAQLPTTRKLQELDEEQVHNTPEELIEGGKIVMDVLESAEKDSSRREETAEFLLSCASNKEIATSIRALCWNKAMRSIPDWEVLVPFSDYDIPIEIKTLSENID